VLEVLLRIKISFSILFEILWLFYFAFYRKMKHSSHMNHGDSTENQGFNYGVKSVNTTVMGGLEVPEFDLRLKMKYKFYLVFQ